MAGTTIRVGRLDDTTGRVMLIIEKTDGPLTSTSYMPVEFDQKVPITFTLNGRPVDTAFHIMPTPKD